MKNVFWATININHSTEKVSFNYFIYCFLILFVIIFPFLAAYASERFFTRRDLAFDTPIVSYNNDFNLTVSTTSQELYYSSRDVDLQGFGNIDASYYTIDNNFDEIIDKLIVRIAWKGFPVNYFKLDLNVDVVFLVSVALINMYMIVNCNCIRII